MKFEEEHFTNFELTPLKGYANESCFAPLNADNAICATTLITNLQVQDDILLASFSANVRNEIRKCEKEYNPQILINENPTQEDIEVHLQYYKAWLDSKKIELIGNIEFYRHRLNVYRKNNSLAIITAKSILLKNLIQDTLFVDKEDKIIRLTTSISTFRNGDSQSQKINAALNKFMKYEIAKHFRNKAFRTFDWGGALKNTALSDSKIGGVSEFKKHCSKIWAKYYYVDAKIQKEQNMWEKIKSFFKKDKANQKPRICLLCDRPNWAHDHSAKEIVNQLSDEFVFDIKYVIDKPKLKPKDYDLLHIFFWGEECYKPFKFPKKKIIKQVSSHRWQDNPAFGPLTPKQFQQKYLYDAEFINCPSKILYDLLKNVCKNLFLLGKGYSPSKFYLAKHRDGGGQLSICWAGNVQDPVKGVQEILVPATKDRYIFDLASDVKHEDLCEFYNEHDVYVVSSKNEADPLPLIEAMACGCFPVANYVGIAPELIRHKENGYLVKERSVEAYQEAFEWCKENLKYIREQGKKNAKELFQTRRWEIMAQGYKAMYKECLKGKK